jgi:hypothetical protein
LIAEIAVDQTLDMAMAMLGARDSLVELLAGVATAQSADDEVRRSVRALAGARWELSRHRPGMVDRVTVFSRRTICFIPTCSSVSSRHFIHPKFSSGPPPATAALCRSPPGSAVSTSAATRAARCGSPRPLRGLRTSAQQRATAAAVGPCCPCPRRGPGSDVDRPDRTLRRRSGARAESGGQRAGARIRACHADGGAGGVSAHAQVVPCRRRDRAGV